ncbi:MAG: sensor histidine kinase [Sediminibacterium sp.]|nr:sensor histidine kinase [Sediminibacterium sp.]MBX9781278.1 sensor histidine kinase [Chitinophagaceae bacterium]
MSPINHKKTVIPIIAHTAAWIGFFALPYLVFFPRLREFNMSNYMLTVIICNNIFLVFFYYLNTQILIPKLLVKEKWLWYVLATLACLIFFLYIPREIARIIVPPDPQPNIPAFIRNPAYKGIMRGGGGPRRRPLADPYNTAIFLLVFTVGTCVSVVQRWLETEQNRKETENEKLNTELSFLKSQVNPHFFFNTLNNIYSLAIVKSDKTATAVLKLSSIMRYILAETEQRLVPLQNEIDFIHNYIELQQVRLTNKVKVHFEVSGNTGELLVAPLIFIAFIENAFKYGVSTKEDSVIDFALHTVANKIQFSARNFIVQSENNLQEKTGIGINNVNRRLELLYPEKHQLSYGAKEGYYSVNLIIYT